MSEADELSLFADLEDTPPAEVVEPEAPPPPRPAGVFTGLIWDRIHVHGKNAVVVVTGPSGSGKSYAGLRLCSSLDPMFGREGVYFQPEQLIRETTTQPKRRGRARMFDEAGVGVHNRSWADEVNKTLIHFMQTWRVWGELLVLTVPRLSFLDSQVLKQCQYWVEMSDTHMGWAKVKSIWLKEELRGKPMWFPYVRATLPSGRVTKISATKFHPPPRQLCEWYEGESRRFKAELQLGLSENLADTRKAGTKFDAEKVALEIVERMRKDAALFRRDLKKGGQRLHRASIEEAYGLSGPRAREVFTKVLRDFPSLT